MQRKNQAPVFANIEGPTEMIWNKKMKANISAHQYPGGRPKYTMDGFKTKLIKTLK